MACLVNPFFSARNLNAISILFWSWYGNLCGSGKLQFLQFLPTFAKDEAVVLTRNFDRDACLHTNINKILNIPGLEIVKIGNLVLF